MAHVLVMGVCGTGKSSVGQALADRLAVPFLEGDAYHSPEAVARMSRGEALTDDHRWDWLDRIAEAARATGGPTVFACSALKRAYRERLAEKLGALDVVHLTGSRDLIARRMAARPGHFMPVSLIDSQFADLQPPKGETAIDIDIDQPLDVIVETAHAFATRMRRPA